MTFIKLMLINIFIVLIPKPENVFETVLNLILLGLALICFVVELNNENERRK